MRENAWNKKKETGAKLSRKRFFQTSRPPVARHKKNGKEMMGKDKWNKKKKEYTAVGKKKGKERENEK